MVPLLIAGGMGVAGAALSHNDAKKQAAARAAALQRSMAENTRIANEEAQANYKAGGIRQGEMLAHLQRLLSPENQANAQQFSDERSARIAALSGPDTAVGGVSPGQDVAARSAGMGRSRMALGTKLDLAQALMAAQDRGRMASARTAEVRGSRAAIPLQEALFNLNKQRMQNQEQLQATLGGIGPSWSGVAGGALSGLSSGAMLFA